MTKHGKPDKWPSDPERHKPAAVLRYRLGQMSQGMGKAQSHLNHYAPAQEVASPSLPVMESVARIVVDVLPGNRVRLSSTCADRFDSSYAPFDEQQAPQEVRRLLTELRDRLKQWG